MDLKRRFEGHTMNASCVVICNDGSQLGSGSCHSTIRSWEINTGRPTWSPTKRHSARVNCLAI